MLPVGALTSGAGIREELRPRVRASSWAEEVAAGVYDSLAVLTRTVRPAAARLRAAGRADHVRQDDPKPQFLCLGRCCERECV